VDGVGLLNPDIQAFHEAHVEAVENGKHKITLLNQPGCKIGAVSKAAKLLNTKGQQDVFVNIPEDFYGSDTVFIDVACVQ
jgi:hypothetical protein